MQCFPGVDNTLVRIQAGKLRQQCGMNIENLAFEASHESSCQNAHEAGQDQKPGCIFLQGIGEGRIKCRPLRVVLIAHALGGDAGVACAYEAICVRPVTDDNGDAEIKRSIPGGIDKRLQIGSVAGNKNCR